jgi:hypothetical protein
MQMSDTAITRDLLNKLDVLLNNSHSFSAFVSRALYVPFSTTDKVADFLYSKKIASVYPLNPKRGLKLYPSNFNHQCLGSIFVYLNVCADIVVGLGYRISIPAYAIEQ